jgi:hypothetical protein
MSGKLNQTAIVSSRVGSLELTTQLDGSGVDPLDYQAKRTGKGAFNMMMALATARAR